MAGNIKGWKLKAVKKNIPPRTIADLERGDLASSNVYRIGLGRLIIFSNLAGIFIAVMAWTNGIAILLLIPFVFALPLIACLVFLVVGLYERLTGTMIGAKPFRISGNQKPTSPFDD